MGLERKQPEDKSDDFKIGIGRIIYFDDVDRVIAVLKGVGEPVTADIGAFAGEIDSAEELKIATFDRLQGRVQGVTAARSR